MVSRTLRTLILIASIWCIGVVVYAQSVEVQLNERAETAFVTAKWKSASTLFDLLLKDSVAYSPLMAKSFYADLMAADSISLQRAAGMVNRNMDRVDRLLEDFSRLCIAKKNFGLYEQGIDLIITRNPERREVEMESLYQYWRLLRYPKEMLRVAEMAVKNAPEVLKWHHYRAQAMQLEGDLAGALSEYQQLLLRYPADYKALIFVGNHYYTTGKKRLQTINDHYSLIQNKASFVQEELRQKEVDVYNNFYAKAADYLERANDIRPNMVIGNTLYDIYLSLSDEKRLARLKNQRKQ